VSVLILIKCRFAQVLDQLGQAPRGERQPHLLWRRPGDPADQLASVGAELSRTAPAPFWVRSGEPLVVERVDHLPRVLRGRGEHRRSLGRAAALDRGQHDSRPTQPDPPRKGRTTWLEGGAQPVLADVMQRKAAIGQAACSNFPDAEGDAVVLNGIQLSKAQEYLKGAPASRDRRPRCAARHRPESSAKARARGSPRPSPTSGYLAAQLLQPSFTTRSANRAQLPQWTAATSMIRRPSSGPRPRRPPCSSRRSIRGHPRSLRSSLRTIEGVA
jgi:hypothetical protein